MLQLLRLPGALHKRYPRPPRRTSSRLSRRRADRLDDTHAARTGLPKGKNATFIMIMARGRLPSHSCQINGHSCATQQYKTTLVVCGNWRDVDICHAFVACPDLECEQDDRISAFKGLVDTVEAQNLARPCKVPVARLDSGVRNFLAFSTPIANMPFKVQGRLSHRGLQRHHLYHQDLKQTAAPKATVFGEYKCRVLGTIWHYLGILVRRGRERRAVLLYMESYVEKFSNIAF